MEIMYQMCTNEQVAQQELKYQKIEKKAHKLI